MKARIPLVLVAGFLGAGKTTFLKELLHSLQALGVRASVIINDFENAAVDAARLAGGAATTVETIDGACVCCTSLHEFILKLGAIEVAPGGVLLVEANGASDLVALISAITVRGEAQRFTSPLQVTLVDAQRWQQRAAQNALEQEQVETSTHWRLTHTGHCPPPRLEQVRQAVRHLSPRGRETDASALAAWLAALTTGGPGASPDAREPLPGNARAGGHDHDHPHHHHHHEDERAFTSLEVPLPPQVGRQALEDCLAGLPPEVLRVKGICVLEECPVVPFSFQHVRSAHEGETWFLPMLPGEILPTSVIIGVGLPVAEIRQRFLSLILAQPLRAST